MAYDVYKIREDFPILRSEVYSHPLVYLDNAATAQKPEAVIAKIDEGYRHANANVHRGVHFLSQLATEAHESARRAAAAFINAGKAEEIVFTRGTTEGINLVACSFADAFMGDGDEVIVSQMEHHSNIVPWQLLQSRKNIKIRVAPILPDGSLDLESLAALMNERTKIVAVTMASNVLGTVTPIGRICSMAHERGIAVLADAAQAAAHAKIDVRASGVDFLAFSAHKVYGPTGIGVLYGREELLEKMPPYQGGGEMIERVSFEKTSFNSLPFKFEAGTPDFIGSNGMAEALAYVSALGIENIAAHENELCRLAEQKVRELEGAVIYGTAPGKAAVLSLNFEGVHPYDLGSLIDKLGIATRTGHHCAQPLMDHYGVDGMLRASFALYNTAEEVEMFAEALKKALKILRR